jgi:hypothetical protein
MINRVPPVKELPQIDARGIQTKTMTGIGVEENGPVVKLLPEDDLRVGYGFFIVFHGMTSPLAMALHSADLSANIQRFLQLQCQGTVTTVKRRVKPYVGRIVDYDS